MSAFPELRTGPVRWSDRRRPSFPSSQPAPVNRSDSTPSQPEPEANRLPPEPADLAGRDEVLESYVGTQPPSAERPVNQSVAPGSHGVEPVFHSLPVLDLAARRPVPAAVPRSAIRRWFVCGARAALLAATWAVAGIAARLEPPQPLGQVVTLAEAQRVLPEAARLGPLDLQREGHSAFAADGVLIGFVLRTSPRSDRIVGYAGPSDLLIGLGPDGRVRQIALSASGDTAAHVAEVEQSRSFWNSVPAWVNDEPQSQVAAVSGSTLTSLAMAEAVRARLSGNMDSLRFPDAVTLDEVRRLFPAATRVTDAGRNWFQVSGNNSQEPLGFAVRTSPLADNVRGYQGPTESLVAVSADRRQVLAVTLRNSYDTPEYVDRVRHDLEFLKQLASAEDGSPRTTQAWASLDFQAEKIEGVSGATQTSFAVAEGIRRRFAAQQAAASAPDAQIPLWRRCLQLPGPRGAGLVLLILGALVVTFTPLRGRPLLRRVWQMALVAAFALGAGELLSIALLAGWARHGISSTAPALILLVTVSLIAPWLTRQQIYCHSLCPHGAVQEWLGRWKRWQIRLTGRLANGLSYLPLGLLLLAFALVLGQVAFELSWLEPFDAWSLGWAAPVSGGLLAFSLLLGLFIPQGYCRFGCPTGALLKLIRRHGTADEWGRIETGWLVVVFLGALSVAACHPDSPFERTVSTTATPRFVGEGFGTHWSVTFRHPLTDPAHLRDRIARELERIESTLSHWRPESETAQFNKSHTTLELEFSTEFVQLLDRARLVGLASDGAYDITVGPLVDAWGHGPPGQQPQPPRQDQIDALLRRVGWDKLLINLQDHTVTKQIGDLQIDLGSLLQGYATDRLAEILDAAGVREYLIDVGGELRSRGTWLVAIENPVPDATAPAALRLHDVALATSARAATNGHIISARTGRPIENRVRSVSVLASTGVVADAWATALLATDDQSRATVIERGRQQGLRFLLIDNSGSVTQHGWPR